MGKVKIYDDVNHVNLDELRALYKKAIKAQFSEIAMQSLNTITDSLGSQTSESGVSKVLVEHGFSKQESDRVAQALVSTIGKVAPSVGAARSSCVKVLYWIVSDLRECFTNPSSDKTLFITGSLDKYSVYTLSLMAMLGYDVYAVDDKFSENQRHYRNYPSFRERMTGTCERLPLFVKEKVIVSFDNIKNGNIPAGAKLLIIGEDNAGELNKFLMEHSESVRGQFITFKNGICPPTDASTVADFNAKTMPQLVSMITPDNFRCPDTKLAAEFARAYVGKIGSVGPAISKLRALISKANLTDYGYDLYISYGAMSAFVEAYTSLLAFLGKSVVVVDVSGKTLEKNLDLSDWNVIELENKVNHEYPVMYQAQTLASTVSAQLDDILYNGDAPIYRDRQYGTCQTINLSTVLEDFPLWWLVENKGREKWEVKNGVPLVPVMFVQLLGTQGSEKKYQEYLDKLYTEHTIVKYNCSELTVGNQVTVSNNRFMRLMGSEQFDVMTPNGLNTESIKRCRLFPYSLLYGTVQDHILAKADALIRSHIIYMGNVNPQQYAEAILNVALNLPEDIQMEMQCYDYTKLSPKMIVLCQQKEALTVNHCILLALLHLCGWDVLLASPRYYNVIGDVFAPGVITDIKLGDPDFNVNINRLNLCSTVNKPKSGLFSRLTAKLFG